MMLGEALPGVVMEAVKRIARSPDRFALAAALEGAARLLETEPETALKQAEAIAARAPGLPQAELLICQALRRSRGGNAALSRLAALAHRQPHVPAVLWEWAQAASEAGAAGQAIAALERLTRLQPAIAGGWFLLARQLRAAGRGADARRADLSGVHASSRDPELLDAAVAMNDGRLDDGADVLEARLARQPDDPAATRLLGEIFWRRGDMDAALGMVGRAVTLAPGYDLARDFLIRLLLQANRLSDALDHAETLVSSPVRNGAHEVLMASVLVRLGDQTRARHIYEQLLSEQPEQPQLWQNLGHVLKTLGEQAAAIHAYRQAVMRQPTMGEAWWSLANLKTVKLSADDIAAMQAALAALMPDAADRQEDIFHLHFSLGKALEDAAEYAAAFAHYDSGNRLRRTLIVHDAKDFSAEVAASARAFDAAFIMGVGDGGCPAPDPIFIVGLPRSGSTLVEQIVASHSQVEGTMELPDMMMIAGRLQSRVDDGEFHDFGTMIRSLAPADRKRLGEEYLERTRVHRQTAKPFFIDKMPNNWQHVGLIRLILPNAKIIDVRRHPMACCFSGWKQHFARGQTFSYDLEDIARYYRDYVSLMAGYDSAAPGAVHRVVYEQLVADTPGEVRRLLDHLGLPFEDACLAFWQTRRSVRTASSEQVRQPIFTDAIEHWRNFAPWLQPLEQALGDLATRRPADDIAGER